MFRSRGGELQHSSKGLTRRRTADPCSRYGGKGGVRRARRYRGVEVRISKRRRHDAELNHFQLAPLATASNLRLPVRNTPE